MKIDFLKEGQWKGKGAFGEEIAPVGYPYFPSIKIRRYNDGMDRNIIRYETLVRIPYGYTESQEWYVTLVKRETINIDINKERVLEEGYRVINMALISEKAIERGIFQKDRIQLDEGVRLKRIDEEQRKEYTKGTS